MQFTWFFFAQENARKAAEKKFSNTVRQAGFSDHEFSKGEQSLEDSLVQDDYRDDFGTGDSADLTFTKTSEELAA